jgi:hypothetical protein
MYQSDNYFTNYINYISIYGFARCELFSWWCIDAFFTVLQRLLWISLSQMHTYYTTLCQRCTVVGVFDFWCMVVFPFFLGSLINIHCQLPLFYRISCSSSWSTELHEALIQKLEDSVSATLHINQRFLRAMNDFGRLESTEMCTIVWHWNHFIIAFDDFQTMWCGSVGSSRVVMFICSLLYFL